MQSKSHYSDDDDDDDDDDDYVHDNDILFWWSLCNMVIMNIKNKENNKI